MPESIKWSIISAFALALIALTFKLIEKVVNDFIDKKIAGGKEVKKNKNFSNKNVKDNSFFGDMSSFIIEIKHTFNHDPEASNKTKALYNIMINKYIIYRTYFESLAKELDIVFEQCDPESESSCCILDNEGLCNKVKKYFFEATTIFKRYYLLSDIYTQDEKDILKYVIGKFMEWHEDRIVNFEKAINDICYSDTVCSKLKINNLLDTLSNAFSDTLEDAKKTLGTLNGELTGKTFENTDLFVNANSLGVKIFEYNKNADLSNKVKYLLNSNTDEDFLILSRDFKDSLFQLKDFSLLEYKRRKDDVNELFTNE